MAEEDVLLLDKRHATSSTFVKIGTIQYNVAAVWFKTSWYDIQ